MANRWNPYEAAFEAWLRARRLPYVAVNESRRAPDHDPARLAPLAPQATGASGAANSHAAANPSLKSVDFIVSASRQTWLIDVKGRRFPAGRRRQYWRNWSTRDDLRSLARWQSLFGASARAAFVFAYRVEGGRAPLPTDQLWVFRGRLYGFVGIALADYVTWSRPISPQWDTWAVPGRVFRQHALPLAQLLESEIGSQEVPQRA